MNGFKKFVQNELDNEFINELKQAVIDNPTIHVDKKFKEFILKYDNDLVKENQKELDRLRQ